MATTKDWKKRRKRQLKRRLIRAAVLAIMAVILFGAVFGIVSVFQKLFGKEEAKEKKGSQNKQQVVKEKEPDETKKLTSNTPKVYTREEAVKAIKKMAAKFPEMNDVVERESEYPDNMLFMLANNPETLEFVKNYPEKKYSGCTTTSIGEVKEGEIPRLLQWDERWGYAAYGENNIAISGCGPTALAMVAAGLKQDDAITPYIIAKLAEDKGYYSEAGTSWDLMSQGCSEYGIRGTTLPLDEKKIKKYLEEGHPIICSVKEGDFTTEGHYVVLTGLQDGKIKLNDPNSVTRSNRLWTFEELKDQIKNLWWYTLEAQQ